MQPFMNSAVMSLLRRMWAFLLGRHVPARGAERRMSPRIPVRFAIAFSADHGRGQGTLSDLSLDGCLIETGNPPPAGTILEVKLFVSQSEMPLEAAATVNWVEGKRMGIKFLRVRNRDRMLKLLSQV